MERATYTLVKVYGGVTGSHTGLNNNYYFYLESSVLNKYTSIISSVLTPQILDYTRAGVDDCVILAWKGLLQTLSKPSYRFHLFSTNLILIISSPPKFLSNKPRYSKPFLDVTPFSL